MMYFIEIIVATMMHQAALSQL